MNDRQWTGKTGGTPWMQRSLLWIFRCIDPHALYPIIAIVIVFYMLFSRTFYHGQMQYWRLCRGKGWPSAVWHSYLTMLRFGMVIMDRFAAYAGRRPVVATNGLGAFRNEAAKGRGAFILSSHIGNQELAGYTFHTDQLLHIVMAMTDTATVNDNRRTMFSEMNMQILPTSEDGSHVFAIHEAIERGEIVSMHADRSYPNQRTICVKMWGAEAYLPEGPFRLAIAEKAPIYTLMMMKEHGRRYTLTCVPIAYDSSLPKRQQVQSLAQAYADQLVAFTDRYPHQWFHFYKFFT